MPNVTDLAERLYRHRVKCFGAAMAPFTPEVLERMYPEALLLEMMGFNSREDFDAWMKAQPRGPYA